MRSYLDAFHSTYAETARARLPADLRASLARYGQLEHGIVGYVSTNFGAGFEYVAGLDGLEVRRGSARVEDLVFDAPGWVRRSEPLIAIGGRDCSIEGGTLEGTFPIRLTSTDASVRLRDLRAKAGSWTRDVEWAELFADRRAEAWSDEKAVQRSLDELLVATVDAREMERRRLDIGDFLQRFRQQHVLLLGDFVQGQERLDAIADALERRAYLPVRADSIPDLPDQDLRQKVTTLAMASRFVAVDDSSRGGQIAEIPLLESARAVVAVLRSEGAQPSWMTAGVSYGTARVKEFSYDATTLGAVVEAACDWAEGVIATLGEQLDSTFPWRTPGGE